MHKNNLGLVKCLKSETLLISGFFKKFCLFVFCNLCMIFRYLHLNKKKKLCDFYLNKERSE